MSTVIDFASHDHVNHHQRWNRFDRADRFAHYLELRTQGVFQRQAAKQLQVPRTTLQAWRTWQDTSISVPRWPSFFSVVLDSPSCID
jgi:hypothetical protein